MKEQELEFVKIIISIFIGSLLPFSANLWKEITKQRRYESAITKEIYHVKMRIQQKLDWLSRDVQGQGLNQTQLIIDYHDQQLYLGEPEAWELRYRFWEQEYLEIVKLIPSQKFQEFDSMYYQFEEIVLKFKELKMAFNYQDGNPKILAEKCYEDLLRLFLMIEKKYPCLGDEKSRYPNLYSNLLRNS